MLKGVKNNFLKFHLIFLAFPNCFSIWIFYSIFSSFFVIFYLFFFLRFSIAFQQTSVENSSVPLFLCNFARKTNEYERPYQTESDGNGTYDGG